MTDNKRIVDMTKFTVKVGMEVVEPYRRFIDFCDDHGNSIGTFRISEEQADIIMGTLLRTFDEGEVMKGINDIFEGLEIE